MKHMAEKFLRPNSSCSFGIYVICLLVHAIFFLFFFWWWKGVGINADFNSFVCSGGGMDHVEEGSGLPDLPKKNVEVSAAADDSESRIQAARERFLARKANK